MIKRLGILSSIFILLMISACSDDTTNTVSFRAPIYQGMTIASSLSAQTQAFESAIQMSFGINTSQSMSFDDEIEKDFDVVESDEIEYFANLNENVLINVKLSNPDSQVILRFTLNGVIYQSFQFQEGSDSENLILRVNAGSVSGIKEFTIDEIKYIENDTNAIKDAIIAGSRTIKLGVSYAIVPSAIIMSSEIKATSVVLNVQVADQNNLILKAGNTIKAYLYDGTQIIRSKELLIGNNVIQFENLPFNSEYEFAIAAVFDKLDGLGNRLSILNQSTLKTEKILDILSVSSTVTSISFDLSINDADQLGSLTAIEMYKGDTLIQSLTDLSVRTFTNMLSNNEYQIRVTFAYDLKDGTGSKTLVISQDTKTKMKATPIIYIYNVVANETSIEFELDIDDFDLVGDVSAIQLYQGNELIESLADLSVRKFSDLNSDTVYRIEIKYDFDLNDGDGKRTLLIDKYYDLHPNLLEIEIQKLTDDYGFLDGVYFILINESITFEEAIVASSILGGRLAFIDTIEKQEKIMDISSGYDYLGAWIGAFKLPNEEWKWLDGREVDFSFVATWQYLNQSSLDAIYVSKNGYWGGIDSLESPGWYIIEIPLKIDVRTLSD
jgi:hypothetical protein